MLEIRNKKILFILNSNEPSSIVRALVYKEELIKRGAQPLFFNLYSPLLLRWINLTSFYPVKLLFRIINKFYFLFNEYLLMQKVIHFDIIVCVKYTDSILLKKIKSISKAKLVYDFDDAVWLDMFYGEEEFLKKVSLVDFVTSDNNYLAKHSSIYNKNSFVVNGPCQIEKFISYKETLGKNTHKSDLIILGWIGSPSTLFYLYKIYDALELIGEKYPNVRLKLVGTGNDPLLIPPFEKIKVIKVPAYDQNEMIKNVFSFDIGLYPLFLNELSLGRGALKATIYMSGSVPVVCSAIGENTVIIKNGFNGLLANNNDEWFEKLTFLIEDANLRKEIGENGFNFAMENYSIESCLTQLLEIIK